MPDLSHHETEPTHRTFGLSVLALSILTIALLVIGASVLINNLGLRKQGTIEPPAAVVTSHQAATIRVPGALEAVNTYRAIKGLPALFLDDQLTQSAQAKADDLVLFNYWAHSRQGMTPWDFIHNAQYDYKRAGENLAKCWPDTQSLVQAWIESPTHEAVLNGNYEEVGFGISHNTRDNCDYVVGHFGTRETTEAQLPVTGVSL